MSIKLKRVELSNIRSHKYVVFEPEEDGITAICGANGSGKSTIVDSIAWALYGTKPPGVSKTSAIYRDDAVWGEDKCFAKVEIVVDGQLLRVERRMITKGGAVECDVWEEIENSDGELSFKHVAGTAVSQVEAYLRQRLKMDEKGFLAAVLVQQKQVDNLVSATARERAQVIEKLTGISSITLALDTARQESNSLKKVLSLSDVDEDALNDMRVEAVKLQKTVDEKTVELETLRAEFERVSDSAESLKNDVRIEERKINEAEDMSSRINVLDARIESQEDVLKAVIVEKDEKRSLLSRVSTGADPVEVENTLNDFKKQLRENELKLSRLNDLYDKYVGQTDEAQAIIEKSSIKVFDEAVVQRDKSVSRLDALSAKRERVSADIISKQSDVKKLERAVKVLTDGDGSCPTCLQHVEDSSDAVSMLNSQKDSVLTEISEQEALLEKTDTAIAKTENVLANFNLLIEALETVDNLAEELVSAEKQKVSLLAEAKTLNGEIEIYEKLFRDVKRHLEVKQEYDRLLSRAENIAKEVNSMMTERDELKKALADSGAVSSTAFSRLRKKADVAVEKVSRMSNDLVRAEGDLSLFEEKLVNLSENTDRLEKDVKKHKELLGSVEVALSTTKVIEEFREDRIKSSIPVIEMYASDLLSRFTEGRFTQLKIDSKFNATVVLADGSVRPVGLLSGGELSATAMALRLSISMLLNGSSSESLIILDEVLVSQDSNRAELILSTVKEVCKGQVVIIAHNDSIDSIADNVVELAAV